jgi:PAS domain S-box-containing protein
VTQETAVHDDELSRFFSLSIDMLAVAGFDGFFKQLSPSWERTLGWSKAELLAKPYLDFIHPDDLEPTIAEASKISTGLDTIHFENRYRCRDGSYRWLAWTASPSVPEERIYAVARDVTAEKKATEDLRAANEELEAFAYTVSHDLRAPLRAINGFARILVEEHGPELRGEARRYLDLVVSNSLLMGRLVDDLLRFSRLSRQPLRRQAVETRDVVDRALEQLQTAMEGRQVEVAIGPLPGCSGDASLLEQVFVNLIANAVKYTRGRTPARIAIGSSPGADGQSVYFVKDNGAGFDMKYAHKLFGVFQRLHRSEDYEGTGVGLAIVQRIVHRHGGRIRAEAQVDQGASFYFTLGGEQPWQAKAA